MVISNLVFDKFRYRQIFDKFRFQKLRFDKFKIFDKFRYRQIFDKFGFQKFCFDKFKIFDKFRFRQNISTKILDIKSKCQWSIRNTGYYNTQQKLKIKVTYLKTPWRYAMQSVWLKHLPRSSHAVLSLPHSSVYPVPASNAACRIKVSSD